MIHRLGLILLCSAIFFSCAPRRADVLLNTATMPPDRLVELVVEQQKKLLSVVGSGTISFESPTIGGSATFDIAIKKPDSLLAKFEGPFGIDIGTLFLSRERFVLYNSMQNEVTSGVPSARAIRSVVPFDLTYDQIFNAFSGMFPISQSTDALVEYTIENDLFRLTYHCGSNLCTYWVDPEEMLVTRQQIHRADGRVLMEAVASRIKEDEGVRAPRRIQVTFPEEARQVSVFYSSLSLNVPSPSFAYTIPSNARTKGH